MRTTQAHARLATRLIALLGVGLVAGLGSMAFRAGAPKALSPKDIKLIPISAFGTGEVLKFRVHYGWITAGEATLQVGDRVVMQYDRPCYKLDIFGKSVGAFTSIVRIRDNWGSYMDTALMKPYHATRDIEENHYRLQEDVRFDYAKRLVFVNKSETRDTSFKIPNPVFDVVSGYYYLRQVDFSMLEPGTILVLDSFFDNVQYKFKVRYIGKEKIKTHFGRMQAIVLSPVLPANSFFEGENAVKVWLSDDANRVPIKCSAELAVGSVDIDITKYQGTRTPLATVGR